jgi:hypothetical protein
MNAARLRELSDYLLEVEAKYGAQTILQQLVNEIQQVLGNPGNPSVQTQFAQTLERFRTSWRQMVESFSPAQSKLLDEIGATPFFLNDVPSRFEELAKSNNVTPAVVRDEMERYRAQREQYVSGIAVLRDRLKAIGIEPYKIDPGSAEIGLLLPRGLFNNELSGLVKELHTLNRIIRAFSEIAIGKAEPVEIHQISTSDPIFFFGLDPATIALLGAAVTWAIQTWRSVEEIRKIRADTQKVKSFSVEEIEEIFDSKIQKEIGIAIDQKVDELIPAKDGAGRHHEQRNDMKWALESILGRVERGMTVEVRFLPPPAPTEGEAAPANAASFEELKVLTPQLQFPAPDKTPVLTLPPSDPPSEQPRRLAEHQP